MRKHHVALLLVCALLGLGAAAPLGHSTRPCWAKHGTCPATSTTAATVTAPPTTSTQPAPTTATTNTTTQSAPSYLFADDFNGAAGSPPDPTKWWPTPWCSTSAEDAQGCFNPNNAYLDGNGNLALRVTAGTMGRTYDFARIQGFQEGGWPPPKVLWAFSPPIRVEARAKYAPGVGLWSGVWANGVNSSNPLELDLQEFRGAVPTVVTSHVHGPVEAGASKDVGFDGSSDFHVYWADYYSDYVTFGVDAITIGTFAAPAQPISVRLSHIVGIPGTWGGQGGPPPASALPAVVLVDYVHVSALN